MDVNESLKLTAFVKLTHTEPFVVLDNGFEIDARTHGARFTWDPSVPGLACEGQLLPKLTKSFKIDFYNTSTRGLAWSKASLSMPARTAPDSRGSPPSQVSTVTYLS